MTSFSVTETTITTGSILEVTQYKCAGLRMTVQSDMTCFMIYTDDDAAKPVAISYRPTRSKSHWHAYNLDGSEIEYSAQFGPRALLRRIAIAWHAGIMETSPNE